MSPKCIALLVALLAVSAPASARAECGGADDPCAVPLGSYVVARPDPALSGAHPPALVFFHGAGGSGAATLSNRAMVEAATRRGYAVIAPDGSRRPGRRGAGWFFRGGDADGRDELAFTREVLDDAVRRFGIDRGRVLLGGFSIGGSLAWYLACRDAGLAAAYAPVAGAFWRPIPAAADCSGPVRLYHTHGWRDETVPLEGRPLRGGAIYQGDVFQSLGVLRELNGCEGLRADAYDTSGDVWQRWWTRCIPGSALRLALHTGGHEVPAGWTDRVLDWFEATLAADQ